MRIHQYYLLVSRCDMGLLLYNRKYSRAGNFREYREIREIFMSRNCLTLKFAKFPVIQYLKRAPPPLVINSPFFSPTFFEGICTHFTSTHFEIKSPYYIYSCLLFFHQQSIPRIVHGILEVGRSVLASVLYRQKS